MYNLCQQLILSSIKIKNHNYFLIENQTTKKKRFKFKQAQEFANMFFFQSRE